VKTDLPKIEMVSLDSIHKNPDNPRVIKDEKFKKLCQSIKEDSCFMGLRPIIYDETGMILGGNMRYEACKFLELKETPAINVNDLTEDQKKRFIIKDNISNGEWYWDVLANEWNVSDLEEWGLDVPKIDIDDAIDLDGDGNGGKKEQIETCPKCGFQWVK